MEHYYKEVPSGWFNYESKYQLAIDRVKPNESALFVELGVWFGQSMCYAGVEVINSGKNIKVHGVDSFLYGDQPIPGAGQDHARYDEAMRFTEPVRNVGVVTIVSGDTHTVYQQYEDESIDFLFIDANHTYEDVLLDLQLWYPKVKKGGLVCGHDYEAHNPNVPWPGLVIAVNEFLGVENFTVDPNCWTFVHYKPTK